MKPRFDSAADIVNAAARSPAAGRRPWRALGMVRRLDFNTPGYRFESDPVAANEPVLEGRLRTVHLQPGLSMHGTEVVDLHNMVSRVNIKAGLRIVVALAGVVDVHIGGQRVHLRADDSSHAASAAIVSMPDDALFERQWQRGKWERKLALHATPEWLQSHGWLHARDQLPDTGRTGSGAQRATCLNFPDTLCIKTWQPSPHALALAEQMLCHSEDPTDELSRLRLASRALELLYEALSSQRVDVGATEVTKGTLRQRDQERMLRLRSFIDNELQKPFTQPATIAELARHFGLSASVLQRQFRSAFGTSVNDYRRVTRLHHARNSLEQGLSISEAAYQAGYTSAANFATAFRRQFGLSPKSLRARL
ncbi:helix-turn-helix transcriptional regulator [Advenella mimigardefordensis]|uniref:Transcriptional regulator, AraC family n=1 Tax=Advenella mimigardefordensis (strain DSM 17166 / LMG 22922 / DPN7) TaxID=1247726 RepID=W0P6B7_ADVMD|nr:AraC family transcriptional regulator [Advenella mimigardefordensis]AHG62281.1 transcriptional regulator, AraC family [Advenella mimigardefordensis DPN7]